MSDEIVSIYDKVAAKITQIYEQQTHSNWIKEFVLELPKGGRVLDLGCGSGKDVDVFNQLGFDSIGVDASKGMLREAKRIHPKIKLFLMDIRSLEFSDNYFNGVWSWSVLTHLKDNDKLTSLKEAHRVLKKGGIFSQTVWRGRDLFIYKFHKNVTPRPHFLLSTPSWKRLYKEVGFTNLKIRQIDSKKGRGSINITAKKG